MKPWTFEKRKVINLLEHVVINDLDPVIHESEGLHSGRLYPASLQHLQSSLHHVYVRRVYMLYMEGY